jgi:uncharacterized protein Yka (UPF0111/DUF47 family)
MAEAKSKKTPKAKSKKSPATAKQKAKKVEETKTQEVVEEQVDMKESTDEKLRRVGDKLSDAADKGVEVIKDVFGKVKDFSVDAAELTKLKVEIHRLKSERDRLYTVMGEKLWELKDSEKIKEVQAIFQDDFDKLKELESDISQKEKQAAKISL